MEITWRVISREGEKRIGEKLQVMRSIIGRYKIDRGRFGRYKIDRGRLRTVQEMEKPKNLNVRPKEKN